MKGPRDENTKDDTQAGLEPLLLQSYFDGELDDEALREEVEARLRDDDVEAQRLDALREMSELVCFELEQSIEDAAFHDFWARLEPRLDRDPSRDAVLSTAADVAQATTPGWFERMRRRVATFVQEQRTFVVPAFALALVALLVAIPMLMNTQQTPVGEERVVVEHRVIVDHVSTEGDALGAVKYTDDEVPTIWYLGGGEQAPGTPESGETTYPEWLPNLVQRLYKMGVTRRPAMRPNMPELGPPSDTEPVPPSPDNDPI